VFKVLVQELVVDLQNKFAFGFGLEDYVVDPPTLIQEFTQFHLTHRLDILHFGLDFYFLFLLGRFLYYITNIVVLVLVVVLVAIFVLFIFIFR